MENILFFFKMLKNVVGLVTGGSSGLGRATVDRFVREGAKVTLLDLPSSKGADVAKELGEDNCIFIPGDVTKEDSVKTALEEGKAKWGKINAAVNCAGIGVAYKTYNFNKNSSFLGGLYQSSNGEHSRYF